MKQKKEKLHYGWVMVAVGVVMMMSYGIVNNCMTLYIVPICDELGFTRSGGAAISTLLAVGGIIASALSAELYQLMPVKKSMRIAAFVLTAAFFAFSAAERLWEFYVIAVVAGCSLWLLSYVPFAIILGNWFHERGGLVVGMTYMGTGIGGMLFSPVVGRLIEAVGWRSCFAVMSGVVALAVLPGAFIVRDTPAEKGLLPYGEKNAEEAHQHIGEPEGAELGEILRKPAFYIIALCLCALSMANTGYSATFPAYMSDIGYPISAASAAVSGNMASLALGKLSLGWIYDRLGSVKATAISGVFLAGTVASALLLPGTVPLICEIAFFSIGLAFGSVAVPIISREAFGERAFARVNGIIMSLSGVTSAMGPVFSGSVCDATGSYAGSYAAYIAMAAVFTVTLMGCLLACRRKKEDKEKLTCGC